MNKVKKVKSAITDFREIGIEPVEKAGISKTKEDFSHLLDRRSVNEWLSFWMRNVLENYQIVPKEHPPTIGPLKNIYWGKEAAVLASGPSLDQDLPFLPKFRGIVFAGNSTVNPCVANGVTPDWVAVIDADEYIPKQFEGIDLSSLKVLLTTMVHPNVSRLFKPELTWWFNTWDDRHWFTHGGIQAAFPKVDSLLSSCCAPGTMIRLAYFMGIRKIYLLGADFGCPGGKERCSIWEKREDVWIKKSPDPFCRDNSPREIYKGIETTMKLRVSHDAVIGIIDNLPGLEVVDCSHGIMDAFSKMDFEEVVNGRKIPG